MYLRKALAMCVVVLLSGSALGQNKPSPSAVTATSPTNEEQYFLCMVNRARANPAAEAKRLGIDLNEGLPAGTISAAPKQPLAFNPRLIDAARGHTQWMIAHSALEHEEDGGKTLTPEDRMKASGYLFKASYGNGENIGFTGQSDEYAPVIAAADDLFRSLFIDAGIEGRGHRVGLLQSYYRETGIGLKNGVFRSEGKEFFSWLITQDFAFTTGNAFITGVVYADTVSADNFYTPGEGKGRVTITAARKSDSRQFTTTTWESGGYTLELPPGTYQVTASGGALAAKLDGGTVTLGKENVEVDFKVPAKP